MNKIMLSKTLTLSFVVLFIGVSVSSAISVDTKSTISNSNNQSEKCRECNEVSDADLVKVERLLNRIEAYNKLLLVLSKYNPELREISKELSNQFSNLNGMYKELETDIPFKDWPLICSFLESIRNTLDDNYIPLLKYWLSLPENSILRTYLSPLLIMLQFIYYPLAVLTWTFDCYDYYPYS